MERKIFSRGLEVFGIVSVIAIVAQAGFDQLLLERDLLSGAGVVDHLTQRKCGVGMHTGSNRI